MAIKKKPKKMEGFSLFFTTFVGEYVQVTTDRTIKSEIETQEGLMIQETPLVIEGFLLDLDEDYYYLGSGPDEVEHAIRKPVAIHFSIVKQKTIYDEILENTPNPDKEQDFN